MLEKEMYQEFRYIFIFYEIISSINRTDAIKIQPTP